MEQESRWIEVLAERRERQGAGKVEAEEGAGIVCTRKKNVHIRTAAASAPITITIPTRSLQQFPSVPLGRCCLSCEGQPGLAGKQSARDPQATAEQSGTFGKTERSGTHYQQCITHALLRGCVALSSLV